MSIEQTAFNIPHVFMRLMDFLPKKDQKAVALTTQKYNKMAYAFNFWYYDANKRNANIPAQLVAMHDRDRKALPQDRDPQLAQKMLALYESVPKGIEKDVTRFCTPLGLDFLSKVEEDIKKCRGHRTLKAIKEGYTGENLFRALSTFREEVLPLIEKQIDSYGDEMIDVLMDAYNSGTLKQLVSEYREGFVEEYKVKQAWKGLDVQEIGDVTDDVLFECATQLAQEYISTKPQSDLECQRLKAVKNRLVGIEEDKENKHQSQEQSRQPEPLSTSPSLSPR